MCLTITPSAGQFMRRMLRLAGIENPLFRLIVSTGGCSGMSVDFSVDLAPTADDVVVDYEGISVVMAPATEALLEGCTLDFTESTHSPGFVVRGAKAGGCACSAMGAMPVDISRLRCKP